ncbi:isochorismatase family protein [Propionibacterium australiense]|uniref:Isochorismatase family n=1 Tax=Propionibacterium australiense TaxID=119981 RepID=A0A383S7B1_9ACTN|nr:isochorismatase family protein [Propionibacterium australiense]RLP07090.1 isochorismatase family protein [Propionibacterium australiense]SYZ33136.1 Isochorismatase family [Propionibacterium australiense]VEH89152.1 nicotinamidase/pyrazinamidase [Propionibacterium australiense]
MTSPRRALVVIDVQQEYFSGPLEIHYPAREESLARILSVIDAAQAQRLPIVIVRHENPVGAAAFARGSAGAELHPHVAARVCSEWKQITKRYASAFDGTDLADWCRQQRIDTLTLTGYMAGNCVLATAASAAPRGLTAEVLSDATGTPHLANRLGGISAHHLHRALMILLHSNLAAVTTTQDWMNALEAGTACKKSNLVASAAAGEEQENRE